MAPTTKHTTSSRRIRATSLDPSTFAAFGEVVQNPATHHGRLSDVESVSANQGSATKWLDVTHMRNFYQEAASGRRADCVVNMFVCRPRELQRREGRDVFDVKILERHPYTPQMFVPLGVCPNKKSARYLVIVAPTLPNSKRTRDGTERQPPPYPTERPRRKRSLKDILLGSRPNPYTNDHAPSTTPPSSPGRYSGRKGPGPPDLSRLQAFIARGDQAVTYGPGTWHAPMVALGESPMDFVVVQYSNGVGAEDCQEVEVGVDDGGEGLFVDVELDDGVKAKL